MNLSSISLANLFLVAVAVAPGFAATIHVPGDQPTIQAGIDAAVPGDVVLVAPGVYRGDGNRNLHFDGKAITLTSVGGRSVTIIDCEGTEEEPQIGLNMNNTGETEDTVISGFTIRSCLDRGIWTWSTTPTIRDCRVEDCGEGVDGKGLFENSDFEGCVVNRLQGTAVGCRFAQSEYAGIELGVGGVLVDCVVSNNEGDGVILRGNDGGHTLEGCTITGNDGVGLHIQGSFGSEVRNCTIASNGSREVDFVRVGTEGFAFKHCIIADECSTTDIFVGFENYDITFECCAFDPTGVFDETNPPQVSYNGPQVSSDPLFCDPQPCQAAPTELGDYHLQALSPCLPENSPCGELIGAHGGPCEVSDVALDLTESPVRVRLESVVQNGDTVRFRLEGEVRGPIRASLIDVEGRRVLSESMDTVRSGSDLELSLGEGATMKSGVYFLRVEMEDGATVTGKVIVAK